MQQTLKIDSNSVGAAPLTMELYSEQNMPPETITELENNFKKALPLEKDNRILIIGGRCGATAEVLAPYCKQIDIVEEEPYLEVLQARFVDKRNVDYRFNREGVVGND